MWVFHSQIFKSIHHILEHSIIKFFDFSRHYCSSTKVMCVSIHWHPFKKHRSTLQRVMSLRELFRFATQLPFGKQKEMLPLCSENQARVYELYCWLEMHFNHLQVSQNAPKSNDNFRRFRWKRKPKNSIPINCCVHTNLHSSFEFSRFFSLF